MGAKTDTLICSQIVPIKPADKKFVEIGQVLQNPCSEKPLVIAGISFYRWNQKWMETIADCFCAWIKEIGRASCVCRENKWVHPLVFNMRNEAIHI